MKPSTLLFIVATGFGCSAKQSSTDTSVEVQSDTGSQSDGDDAKGAAGVKDGDLLWTVDELRMLRTMWPLPAVPVDPTNAVADNPWAAQLGQFLFFDENLSGNNEVSCATCHDPEQGFGDGERLSTGVSTTGRHAQSLWNIGFNRWFFWDGRCDNMWCQAIGPIEASTEMAGDRTAIAHYLANNSD